MKNRSTALQIALTILPIALSLAITALLIMAVGADPRAVFEKVWEGAFRDERSVAQVVNFWIPLTLVSMGLVVTFTAGLWNIGVEGQMMVGAVFASWAALSVTLDPIILVPLEIILAAIGGMLWALLVGVLKTRMGVHEIFGGVALNALANVFSIYLITGPWQPPEGGSLQSTPPFPEGALLPPLSDTFRVSLLALVIVVVAVVGVVLALRGTRWGLQLKATGKNARSALLLGVPTERSSLTAFMVCGGLAGIAGSYRVLFTYGSLRPLVSGGIGFLGLLVVLLIATRGIWAPFVAFGFAAILGGSTRLKIALQLDASLAGVLQGFLVLTVLLSNGLRQRLNRGADAAPFVPAPAETVSPEGLPHE
ncbi:MAG: ABC transporter permease [Anaerolineaceae bacterium]|nr:ABC transporter permease [Anaerolineaceae bacterium]